MTVKSVFDLAAARNEQGFTAYFRRSGVKNQLAYLLERQGRQHLHRDKRVGQKTDTARRAVLYQFFDELREQGFKIESVLNLSQKHIEGVTRAWEERGLAASTIQTRFSILRWLAKAIGKPGLVREPTYYGLSPDTVARTYVARQDKSWTGKAIDPEKMIAEAHEHDEWSGIQLRLSYEFGLRFAEAIRMKPWESDQGNSLIVREGTKGGLMRAIPILKPSQREALDEAKRFGKRSARGNLMPPGLTFRQATRRLRYACERIGLTKAALGVTPHGLRHQYANDRFEDISGRASFVRGGEAVKDDVEADALGTFVKELGHSRIRVGAAYVGSRSAGRPKHASVSPDTDTDTF